MTIDAQSSLEADIPGCVVDAAVSEQWGAGIETAEQLRASGELGAEVVVALGTNGVVTDSDFQQMMAALSGVSRVVFVTNHVPRSWEEGNNAVIVNDATRYATARVADWNTAANAHPEWFYSDGTHMPEGGAGAAAFAALVKAQL
ncbi:MAG: hypothetical protein ACRDZT_05295 [Acidimicrobiales bacterium]